MKFWHSQNYSHVGNVMRLVTKRKSAQQSCFVQTVEKTTTLPANVDRCLRKTARIADEVITPKNTVQQRG